MDRLHQIAFPHAVESDKAIYARRELQARLMDIFEVEDIDIGESHFIGGLGDSQVGVGVNLFRRKRGRRRRRDRARYMNER